MSPSLPFRLMPTLSSFVIAMLNLRGIEQGIRMRTREGMAIARAQGRLHGKQPKLSPLQRRHLMVLHAQGEHGQAELAELFGVARSTIYATVQRESIASRSEVLE